MPTTRRRRVYRLLGAGLTDDQRQHLETGHAFFVRRSPFASEAERRACWCRHRRALLREWDRAGSRPAAFWDFEAPDALGQHQIEAAAVHALFADAREKRLIELEWLDRLRVAAVQASADEHVVGVAATLGVPAWFADRHAPTTIADQARSRAPRGAVIELER